MENIIKPATLEEAFELELKPVSNFNVTNNTIQEQEPKVEVLESSLNFATKPTFKQKPFIEANTQEVTLEHLKSDCITPVFKDNEVAISHPQFIDTVISAVLETFGNTSTLPQIRCSHVVKGRTPDAIHIPVKELQDHQKTIYYERLAWIVQIPSITKFINGNEVTLCVGGVKSYASDNLSGKHTAQRFKLFIGYSVKVCTNLCIFTDGLLDDVKVYSTDELYDKAQKLFQNYNAKKHLKSMQALTNYSLSEHQFAQLIGKARLYHYLPKSEKLKLPKLLLTDSQFSTIAKDYFEDESFCRNDMGNVNLWDFYNMLTSANKSSYIDTFINRDLNAFDFVSGIINTLQGKTDAYHWFLS